jgi:ergothioneine biosynthesis protein EgtB
MTEGMATAAIDDPSIRRAGAELLSLALIDARNHTLHLLAQFEKALGPGQPPHVQAQLAQPLWIAGHVAWLPEYWIARNPQRSLGSACPQDGTRLASIDPDADGWFDPVLSPPAQRGDLPLEPEAVKAYMLDTLETTLELMEKAGPGHAPLHFFRMALWHEDLRGEALAVLAQTLGVPLPLALPAGLQQREPLVVPAARWSLGFDEAGFAPAIERGRLQEPVPEFEIDAQPVGWAQFVEFIDDGGYDREALWAPQGWQWLTRQSRLEGRRGPRHVEQIGVASGAVMQSLFGRTARMGGSQAAMHVSWWEADAYARWAGRRLATEVEWEMAAHAAARRGFRWGDVAEWTAPTLSPWPGYAPDAWAASAEVDPQPVFAAARVIRGASFAARARMKHPKARAWALPGDDSGFVGFRTCAI